MGFFFGSKVTATAKETLKIISQIVDQQKFSESEKIDFIFFMSQARSRDFDIQNDLFKINWSVLVTVSEFELEVTIFY